MNMNYSYPTTMYESILAQMYAFLVLFACFCFLPRKSFKQKLQKIFFYQKYVHLGENNSIHFSRITVVHIRVIFSLKFTIHVIQWQKRNQMRKQPKMTDKHAAEYSKIVCWDVN